MLSCGGVIRGTATSIAFLHLSDGTTGPIGSAGSSCRRWLIDRWRHRGGLRRAISASVSARAMTMRWRLSTSVAEVVPPISSPAPSGEHPTAGAGLGEMADGVPLQHLSHLADDVDCTSGPEEGDGKSPRWGELTVRALSI